VHTDTLETCRKERVQLRFNSVGSKKVVLLQNPPKEEYAVYSGLQTNAPDSSCGYSRTVTLLANKKIQYLRIVEMCNHQNDACLRVVQ